jgi:hypothetical protein
MPDWLYDLPIPQIMLLMIIVFVGGTWLGAFLVRPILRLLALSQADWNELVSAGLSCFGVFYGLLLGLLAVAAFQNQSQVQNLVSREALSLGGLYVDLADVYPQDVAAALQADLKEYCLVTIEKDWPEQRKGRIPAAGTQAMRRLLNRIRSFEPRSEREGILHEKVLGLVEAVRDTRRERLYSVTVGLPGTMWYVVMIGAVINICFVYLFNLRFFNVLLLGGILSFFIATVIGLIIAMDRPMRGPHGTSADPFVTVSTVVMDAPKP